MKAANRFLRMSLTWAALMAILFLLPALWDKAGKGGLWTGRVIAFFFEILINLLLNFTFPNIDAFSPHLPKIFGLLSGFISLALSAGFLHLPFPASARTWFESLIVLLLFILGFSFLFQIFKKRRINALWCLSDLCVHGLLSISIMGWIFAPALWTENEGWEAGALMIAGILWEFLLFSLSFILITKSVKEGDSFPRSNGKALTFAPALAIPLAIGGLLPAFFCACGI